jgi:hypothetical protein
MASERSCHNRRKKSTKPWIDTGEILQLIENHTQSVVLMELTLK